MMNSNYQRPLAEEKRQPAIVAKVDEIMGRRQSINPMNPMNSAFRISNSAVRPLMGSSMPLLEARSGLIRPDPGIEIFLFAGQDARSAGENVERIAK
jgi:hypothetical protein